MVKVAIALIGLSAVQVQDHSIREICPIGKNQVLESEIRPNLSELGITEGIQVEQSYYLSGCLARKARAYQDGLIFLQNGMAVRIKQGAMKQLMGEPVGVHIAPTRTPVINGMGPTGSLRVGGHSSSESEIVGWVGVWNGPSGSTFSFFVTSENRVSEPETLFTIKARVLDIRMGLGLPDALNVPISFVGRQPNGRKIIGSVYWPSAAKLIASESEKFRQSPMDRKSR